MVLGPLLTNFYRLGKRVYVPPFFGFGWGKRRGMTLSMEAILALHILGLISHTI